jgi:hypothetical protein
MSKRRIFASFVAVAALSAASARADDAACLDAASKGQRFRATHKLVEARDKFRICGAAACPTVVQTDCSGWLAQVEKGLPSVVVTAKDDSGTSVIDVKVSVDGAPFAARLDGQAMAINPGSHTFHFEAAGVSLDQVAVVVEGEQNQRISVVLAKNRVPPVGAPEATTGQAAVAATPQEATRVATPRTGGISPTDRASDTSNGSERGGGPWRTVGWIAAGAGLAGVAVGTVFGVIAIDDHNDAHCNASNICLTGPLNSARSAAGAADIGYIAGGALAAAGLAMVLLAPGSGTQQDGAGSATVGIALAQGVAGLRIDGRW